MSQEPLRFLHPAASLNKVKLMQMEKLTSAEIIRTLCPGEPGCLKARPDGTVLDGHHRLHILRQRGIEIDSLPRVIVVKSDAE